MDDEENARFGRGGMLDRSRLALCMFVFTLLVVNPLGVLVGGPRISSNSEERTEYGAARTILSSADDGWNYTLVCMYIGVFVFQNMTWTPLTH